MEDFLSRRRADRADRLIPTEHRGGRLLDIGCGSHPYFLQRTAFTEKHGLDQTVHDIQAASFRGQGIALARHDAEEDSRLPYPDAHFQAVTMLAVVEHVERSALEVLLSEVHRVLVPGGVFVVTTPAHWTDPLLKAMAMLGLVSKEEIHEHQQTFTPESLKMLLVERGFQRVEVGVFEAGMNVWGRARK